MGLTATVADLLITSPANPRLKAVVALRRRRTREDSGTTLVEGHEELALALASGIRPQTLFVCPELFSPAGQAGRQDIGRQEDLVEHARQLGAEVVRLSRTAFEKVAYREGPDGLLGVVPAAGRALSTLDVDDDALLLVAQRVEKPGNLGAMLRTADAAGVTAVVAADPVTDWGNPNVVRASKGTVFAVPVATATTTETLALVGRPERPSGRHHARDRPALHRRRPDRPRGRRRRGREARRRRRPAGGCRIPSPNSHARQGELAERRGVRGHRSLRGAPAADGRTPG